MCTGLVRNENSPNHDTSRPYPVGDGVLAPARAVAKDFVVSNVVCTVTVDGAGGGEEEKSCEGWKEKTNGCGSKTHAVVRPVEYACH